MAHDNFVFIHTVKNENKFYVLSIYICIYVCVCVCVYIYMCVCVYVYNLYIYLFQTKQYKIYMMLWFS